MGLGISVLMANRNKANYLAEAIRSVRSQSYDNWELLILDDCSSDDSISIINDQARTDERIKIYCHQDRRGFTRSLLELLGQSQKEIIAIVDSDDAIAPKALEKVAAVYDQNPHLGYVYSQCWYCDESLSSRHLGYSRLLKKGESNLDENAVVALRTFRRSAYEKTTGFDVGMEPAEDYDLTLKLEEVTDLFFIDEPLYFYRILKKSQTRGLRNELKNKSKVAIARLSAYERRQCLSRMSLSRAKISRSLFVGMICSFLSLNFFSVFKLAFGMFRFNPFFFVQIDFYRELAGRSRKILNIKRKEVFS